MPSSATDAKARRTKLGWRWIASLIVLALIALSWNGSLDDEAQGNTQATLTRALTTYALARGLNGVISVAQGTEIAIQPVGVGVTITAGEILDPLNDLVERFSWLALMACASLGTQLLLTELLANPWISGLLTGTLVLYLTVLWWPGGFAHRGLILRACALVVFTRFLFTAVTLVSGWVDQAVLADRQAEAVAELTSTQAEIEDIQTEASRTTDPSVMDRFSAFLDEQRQALDVETQLAALQARVESAIEHVVRLMVVFVVQTLLIPLAALGLAYACLKRFWRWTWRGHTAVGDSANIA